MARPIVTNINQSSAAAYTALGTKSKNSLHLVGAGAVRDTAVTRLEWLTQAAYDLLTPSPSTLYLINATMRGRGTAHRWPLAADTATAFYLGSTLLTAVYLGGVVQ